MKNIILSPRSRGYVTRFVFATAALFTAPVVIAQSGVTELAPYVTSATRTPTDVEAVTSVVTVLELDDLASAQINDLSTALAQVPGLSVVQTGAVGGPTSIFTRGSNSDHTLFFVDGVRLNTGDARYTAFLGAADLNGIGRIEVLNGAQSTLYGASAIGGVVVIDTMRGQTDRVGSIYGHAGSFDTYGGALQVAGLDGVGNYSFALSTLSTANDRPYSEFDQLSYSGRVEATLDHGMTVGMTLRAHGIHLGFAGERGLELHRKRRQP